MAAKKVKNFEFTKTWRDSNAFPTYEDDETQVREDLQCLHDEMKDYINQLLLPKLNGLVLEDIVDSLQTGRPLSEILHGIEEDIEEIGSGSVEDGGITEAKLADDAVTETKLADGAVTEDKIADDAVAEDKIQDAAVSTDKIQNGAVRANNLATDSVTTEKIVDDSVTSAKIAASTLLEDVTSDVQIICDSGHGFVSHLKFRYSRALGLMYVSGYVEITPSQYDFDINAQCRMTGYLPAEATYLAGASPYSDVGYVGAWFADNHGGSITFESDYSSQYGMRPVHLNGFYLCAGE